MAVYKLIKLKRDYAANWTLRNPTLSLGEPGYERDSGKLKIGDGVTPWVDLDYIKVDMDDVVIDPDDLADVLNDVLQGGFGIDIVYSDPSDTILIRTTGLATQSDLIALSGDVANLDSALIFRGITDPTQPNSAPTNPAPANGDMWISNAEGKIDGTWVNLSGQDIVVDQFMLYEQAANGWVLGGNAVGVDLSEYATKTELNNLQYQVNQNAGNISINYLDIQKNIVDILNLKNSTNNQQTQIDALIAATGHIHDQDIYDLQNADIVLSDRIIANSGRSDSRDDNLQAQINAISGATPPEVDLSVISGYVAANTASGVVVLGKADQNSDDIATLSGLIDGGLDFKGYIDPTATGLAPSLPTNGDLWVSDSSGVIDNGWTCLGGQDVGVNQWMIYSDDDNCWQLGPVTDIDLSAYALKTELNAVSGLVDQNADDIVVISGLLGSGIPSGLVEYSTGLAIRHGNTEVSVNEVSGNSVIDLTNWKIKDGHFIPNSNAAFDLGNAEYKVRHLFLSDNSIYMGSGKLSSQGNDNPVLLWQGEPLAKITDINTIVSGELAEQKLLDLQDVTSDGPVEEYAVPVYNQGTTEYKVKRLSPLEVEDTSTPPLDGYPVGSLGNELQDMKGDIQSNTILISGIAEDIVEIPDAVIFKGVTDPTVSGSAPAGPDNGDMWVSNNTGLIDGSWTGLSGEDVLENQFLLYSTGLNVWLKGGKIDVNDLSDQYLPLTGNLNPNDRKLDAVEFTSNVVTTSVSGLHPQNFASSSAPGLIGNLTYINHPVQSSPLSAQVYGPSEFNLERLDYSDDWKDGLIWGYDCLSIGYHNEPTSGAGYSWGIKVGPPSRYFPSGIDGNGNPYQQRRHAAPNPMGIDPAFLAQRATYGGLGAFEFRPVLRSTTTDLTTTPYQIGFQSAPQNQISFDQVYAKDPSATPTYVGFASIPYQQTFSSSGSKGYALHCDFQAGASYQLFGEADHGRVYGFYADMSNRHGANCAGFIERGADFNQLQAPTVFGADTIYGGSNPFNSANIYKPTDQIDLAQGGIRIRNAKLVQESTSGNPGQIGWDQNGLLCYTSSSWKRAPLLRFTTTVTNPTPDSVALIVGGNAKLTATANDLQAAAGYVPQTDNSLVTKANILDTNITAPTTPNVTLRYDALSSKWVDSGAGSVIVGSEPIGGWGAGTVGEALENGIAGATLPISSADDRVTLSSPSGGMFKLTADSKDKIHVTEDDIVVYQTRGNPNTMTFVTDRTTGNTAQHNQFKFISSYANKPPQYFGCDVYKGIWRFSASETAGTDTITIEPMVDRIGFAQTNNNNVYLNSPTGNVFTVTMGSNTSPVEKFRLTADDAQMFAGYVPQTDDSLITKRSLTVQNLDDVEFPVGPSPVAADQILRYSTINNKWVNSDAGNAVLGNTPLGGWAVGSVGEAISNAGGGGGATLPISSVDNNLEINQAGTKSFGFNIQGSTAVEISQNNGSNAPTIKIGDPQAFGTHGVSVRNSGTLGSSQSHYRLVSPTGTDGTGEGYTYLGVTNPTFSFAGTVLTSGTAYVASQIDMVVGAGVDINDTTRAIKFNVGGWAEVNTEMKIERNKIMTRPAYNYWACGNDYDIETSKFYLHYRGDSSKYQVGVGIPPSQAQMNSDFVVGSPISGASTVSTIQSRGFATIQYQQFRGDDGYFNITRQNQNGVISFASNEDSTGRGSENIMQFLPTTQAIRMNYNVGLNCAVGDTRLQVENPGVSGTQATYGSIFGGNMGSASVITNASCRQDQTTAAGFYAYNSVSANVTLGTLYQYRADGPTTMAGSVGVHVGYYAGSSVKHGTNSNYGFYSQVPTSTGPETNYAFYAGSEAPSRFNGQIQTNTITSKDAAAGDASIQLGANLVAKVGDGQVINFQVNNSGKLTISDNDITTWGGYIPTSDQSLVTKQFLTVSNLDDVEFPVGPNPVSANQILCYSTINNKWSNSNAGNAVLGSTPLGGWAVGSVGEAISNAGGGAATLPISSVDGTVRLDGASNLLSVSGSVSSDTGSSTPFRAISSTSSAYYKSTASDNGGSEYWAGAISTATTKDYRIATGAAAVDTALLINEKHGLDYVTGGTVPVTRLFSQDHDSVQAGSLLVDYNGRLYATSTKNTTNSVARNSAVSTYAKVETGNTRVGYSLRATYWGDTTISPDYPFQGISYLYGFYSNPIIRDIRVTSAFDFSAVGPQSVNSSGTVSNICGFMIASNFGSQALPPSGQEKVLKYGVRSDLAEDIGSDGNHKAFNLFVNGNAPSRFVGNVELAGTSRLRSSSATSNELFFSGNATVHEGARIIMRPRPESIDPNVPSDGQYYLQFDQSRDPGTYAFRLYQYPSGQSTPLAKAGYGATVMYTNNTTLGIMGGSGINFNGDANSLYGFGNTTAMLKITPQGDLETYPTYIPATENSLVDKKFVKVANLSDVEYPVGPSPVSDGEILIFSDINNKWLPRDAGSANLGSTPLGGWPVGSVGEAIDNAGGGAANVQQGFIVATGTQTDFTVTQGYTSGQMDVYLNGVKMLDNTDYTAGDGSTIVLARPATSGDIVQVTTYTNLASLSLTTDDITVPATIGSSFALNNGAVTQTDLNSDFDTRISQTSVCSLADMDCGFFGGDGDQFNQPSKNPKGWVLATKTGTAYKDANGANVYEYATSGDIPTFRPTPVVGSFYLAKDTNIYYTWDGASLVNDPSNQPTLPINLSYEWGTAGAYGLKMGNKILAPINAGDGPQDPVAGTLQEVLYEIDERIHDLETAANFPENTTSPLATSVQSNTNQIAANVTDIATNASDISTLQGTANALPVNGTNTVAIAQDGTTKKIDIKTDSTVRASVSDTQAQFNVPVNLASAAKFTPATENAGSVGDITFDDNYVWVRTSTGWKKSPLYTFDATPAVSIRVTDAQYQALVAANTVDPNITYIIIG